ncbi:hypothetical protein ANCDUO_07413 [Ancylostoma duodenale]|uniref:Uncharacterized protein n=1 Tax=Ancylostoma duodenale TaxID=51022 RepID=A0A0C2GM57_9BILA|nr:hypothetical protein ANCDUO_07413 [Ancylostoma duodenale]
MGVFGKQQQGKQYVRGFDLALRHLTMWKSDNIKKNRQAKKRCYHTFLADKSPTNWQGYRMVKSGTKKAVAYCT